MKFLIDNQLPAALARYIQQLGIDSIHVSDIGLEASTDQKIWEYALSDDRIIVNKDSDFIRRVQLGGKVPQILWIRCGNCSKQHLFNRFSQDIGALTASIKSGRVITELS